MIGESHLEGRRGKTRLNGRSLYPSPYLRYRLAQQFHRVEYRWPRPIVLCRQAPAGYRCEIRTRRGRIGNLNRGSGLAARGGPSEVSVYASRDSASASTHRFRDFELVFCLLRALSDQEPSISSRTSLQDFAASAIRSFGKMPSEPQLLSLGSRMGRQIDLVRLCSPLWCERSLAC